MPKEIYNEGRVVGFSAYELYVKHSLQDNPELEPASEREWLSSTLGNGSSMVLTLQPDNVTELHTIDIELPETSTLASASVITAMPFLGECEVDSKGWAVKVTSYGDIMTEGRANNLNIVKTDATNYDKVDPLSLPDQAMLAQYLKLIDGGVLQPGTWMDNKGILDLTPNLTKRPIIRLIVSNAITKPVNILFTGFANRNILSAISGIDTGSCSKINPQNGDFLGPQIYPWANKIVFTIPSIIVKYIKEGMISTNNFLKIDTNDDDLITKFTPSKLIPGKGVGFESPVNKGDDVVISSIIDNDPNKYIKVTQTSGTNSVTPTTTLTHSRLEAGEGMAVSIPDTAGQDVIFTSKIKSHSQYLKVDQKASSDPNDITTSMVMSEPKGGDGISISSPQNVGGEYVIHAPIESTNPSYLKVIQSDGKTILKPLEFKGSGLITVVEEDDGEGGKRPVITINIENLAKELLKSGALSQFVTSLLKKIGDGKSSVNKDTGVIDWKGIASGNTAIPVGNMNIYSSSSGTSLDRYIKSKASTTNGDLRVN